MYIKWEEAFGPRVNQQVRAFTQQIKAAKLMGIFSIIPAFSSITIFFDPKHHSFPSLKRVIENIHVDGFDKKIQGKSIRIPVCYGGSHGPDLEEVAQMHTCSVKELIELHTGTEFFVYMHGFLPGFAYMGHFPTLAPTPRKKTPRTLVPKGSVALAGYQTGIYPSASSGGWQLIGQTPIPMIHAQWDLPFLIQAEDRIHFFSIGEEEFEEISRKASEGNAKKEQGHG